MRIDVISPLTHVELCVGMQDRLARYRRLGLSTWMQRTGTLGTGRTSVMYRLLCSRFHSLRATSDLRGRRANGSAVGTTTSHESAQWWPARVRPARRWTCATQPRLLTSARKPSTSALFVFVNR